MQRAHVLLCVVLAAGLGIGAAAGVGLGFARWRHAPSAAFRQVQEIVLARAADTPPGGVVVLGDSIVEQQQIDRLCGRPALNAGISGARIGHYAGLASRIVAAARPWRTVVALGTNDVRGPKPTPPPVFARQLDAVLAAAGPHPVVVGVAGPGAAGVNRLLADAAARRGGVFVEPPPATLTVDGVHLNPEGKRDWRRRVDAACG